MKKEYKEIKTLQPGSARLITIDGDEINYPERTPEQIVVSVQTTPGFIVINTDKQAILHNAANIDEVYFTPLPVPPQMQPQQPQVPPQYPGQGQQ